jgi:uncharacterized membrane protein (DUF2068 family)
MRPFGTTLVGFYQILRGVIGLVFGLSILLFTDLAAKLTAMAAESNALQNSLHSFGRGVGIVVIVFALLHLLAGYGVLQMHNWGRLLTLLFSAVGLVLLLPGVVIANPFSVLFAAIDAIIILYLAMPPVKRAFRAESNAMRMAA